jgi:gag-polypeptide of LTR copia-type
LYSHIEGDEINPNAPWPASFPPVLAENPTAAKHAEFRNWWKDDARAMLCIERKITQVQIGLLPSTPDTTARDCWNKLRELYGRLDVHAQFALMDKVAALRLKDHNDCDRYLSEFSLARAQFAKMGVEYTELQAIHALIKGLPTQGSWTSFTQIVNTFVGKWVRSEARKAPADREIENALWENLVSRLSQECQHLSTITKSSSAKKNGPGSEYAGYSSNIVIRKTKQNPNGVKCTNCGGILHDFDHCFAAKGGMAGLREACLNKTGQFAKPAFPKTAPVVAAFSSEIVITNEDTSMDDSRPGDFSFASIEDVLSPEDLACVVNTNLSALLGSSASSHIIKDFKYFWNYDRQGAKSVKTANHGNLSTLASGDCIAIVKCGKLSTRVTLRNCFHAPSAVINLLSVGKMVSAGFGCNFEDNKVVISAPRPNKQTLCEGPMLNNLFFLDIEFLPALLHKVKIPRSHHFSKPSQSSSEPFAIIEDEVVNFAKVPVDAKLIPYLTYIFY